MKNIISYILAVVLVVGGLGVASYFFFSNQLYLPWLQKADEGFLNEPQEVLIDDGDYSDFERSDIKVTEVETPYEENELKPETSTEDTQKTTTISTYYNDLVKPRMMALSPFGDLVVSDISAGGVYALIDEDKDFKADKKITIIKDLKNPHGLAFNGKDLYIAETDKVRVLRGLDNQYKFLRNDLIIKDLTNFDGHFTRSLLISGDKLYVSVGSSCNVCNEKEENRSKILSYNLDGTGREVYATGLRNAVGLAMSPDGRFFATENGRDWLGDDLPPDEINLIEKSSNYGWPFCYGQKVRDESYSKEYDCSQTVAAFYEIKAHSAPLGLEFYSGGMFQEYEGDLFVALHGSWNAKEPVGYQLVRYDFENGIISKSDVVLDIFLKNEQVKGRPVDIAVGSSGEIFVSDDFGGRIYVIYKK